MCRQNFLFVVRQTLTARYNDGAGGVGGGKNLVEMGLTQQPGRINRWWFFRECSFCSWRLSEMGRPLTEQSRKVFNLNWKMVDLWTIIIK